jgi:hypothetical protein
MSDKLQTLTDIYNVLVRLPELQGKSQKFSKITDRRGTLLSLPELLGTRNCEGEFSAA